MIPMSQDNARAIVEQIVVEKAREITSLEARIYELEQADDGWELTEALIKRLKTRLVHRRLEFEALGIILN